MKSKYYKILWWSIPVVLILLLLNGSKPIELQIHSTYLVFSSIQLAIILSLILGVLGGLYWMFREYKLVNVLSWIHAGGTSLGILGFSIMAVFQTLFAVDNLDAMKVNLITILVLIQFLFIVNMILGLCRGKV